MTSDNDAASDGAADGGLDSDNDIDIVEIFDHDIDPAPLAEPLDFTRRFFSFLPRIAGSLNPPFLFFPNSGTM